MEEITGDSVKMTANSERRVTTSDPEMSGNVWMETAIGSGHILPHGAGSIKHCVLQQTTTGDSTNRLSVNFRINPTMHKSIA